MEAAGAELLALCSNYMHKTAPVLEDGLAVPFLHIADVAARSARTLGVTRVGLTGTGATMSESFYADRLRSRGLDVLVPDPADRELFDRAIFDELCRGVLSEDTRASLRSALARLVDQGAEAIVLACTELELLLGPADGAVPLLPTARLHVRATVEGALLNRDSGRRIRARGEAEIARRRVRARRGLSPRPQSRRWRFPCVDVRQDRGRRTSVPSIRAGRLSGRRRRDRSGICRCVCGSEL